MASEPGSAADLRGLLLDYLDFYREVVLAKVEGLPKAELTASRLPSGWAPAQLVNHLVFMERRWFVWGFLGAPVADPWGDWDGDRWATPAGDAAALAERLRAGGRRTREIVEAHGLGERAAVGGRFATEDEAPLLQWVLLHVLQEYARHAGHADVVRELVDGATGEAEGRGHIPVEGSRGRRGRATMGSRHPTKETPMTNEQQHQVDPARAGVSLEHSERDPEVLGQNEVSMGTELDETMPITDDTAEHGA